MSKKNVVLFGLSANPPTGLEGHMGIVKYFSKLFDELWILPVYRHAYSTKRKLELYETRIQMLSLALQDCGLDQSNIFVKTYEKECFHELYPNCGILSSNISYGTYDLVRWLKDKFPDYAFSMIIGEDAFNDICNGLWRESDKLCTIIHFEVLPRKGVSSISPLADARWYTEHPDIELGDVSSTQARNATTKEELEKFVCPSVASYIISNQLYSYQSN